MDAFTDIEVSLDARGTTVLTRCRCEPPMLVRLADEPGPVLHLSLVNGTAGPLGGDRLRFRLVVGSGAHVVVRSVAASMAQPGPSGERSTLEIELTVDDGATLDWQPEPMVSVRGSDHHTRLQLVAASSAIVIVREAVSLGRRGEPPGRLSLRQRVTIAGESVLDHETVFAPGALVGPGAQGAHRLAGAEIRVGKTLPEPAVEVADTSTWATFALAPNCALTTWTDHRASPFQLVR
jgi:urease accessory protein